MKKHIRTSLPWLLVGILLAVIASLLWKKPEPNKEPPRQPDSGATEIVRTVPPKAPKAPVAAGMALPHP